MTENRSCRSMDTWATDFDRHWGNLTGRERFPGTHKQALTIKGKTDKLDFIKIKNFCSSKDIIKAGGRGGMCDVRPQRWPEEAPEAQEASQG